VSAPQFRCPHCATQIPPPQAGATQLQCPKCGAAFALVIAPVAPTADIPEAVEVDEPAPQPWSGPAGPMPEVYVDEEDQPAPEVYLDEEEAPRSKRRRRKRDEEEDEDRPRRKTRRGAARRRGHSGAKIVLLTCVAALALVGIVFGVYLVFGDLPEEVVKKEQPPPAQPKPPPEPPKPPPLTPEQMIRKVKASTVYIRTLFRGGMGASGSGFFAGKPGYVITNAHVIGYGPDRVREPELVQVVINSGEPGEHAVPAKVFGLDAAHDLAVLFLDVPSLPPPLTFGRAEELVETQEVVIFGYPFGETLGKNVSVNRTTVSSLRKANGWVETVQLAGGLNPGNSGGPVTNAKGEVIGVSVAKLRGTDTIGFAIPAETTSRFMDDMIACGGEIRLGYLQFLGQNPLVGQSLWAALRIAPPKPLPITPPKIADAGTEVKLPAAVDSACVGGGGRFIIFHLSAGKELAVFDVSAAKVVKTIPVPEKALFAAGMNALIVADPKGETIDRWNLTTFTKEETADLPVKSGMTVLALAMGSASDGPLLVQALDFPLGERFLFDITTMKEVKGSRTSAGIGVRRGDVLRASADGRTFTHSRAKGKASVITVTDTGYHEVAPWPLAEAAALPSGDGQVVYAPGLLTGRAGLRSPIEEAGWTYLPAAHGPLFLAIPQGERAEKHAVEVRAGRDPNSLFELPRVPELEAVLDREKVPQLDRHVFFVPDAKVLAVLAPDGETLTLHKLDVDAQLAKAGDYAFVTSAPPQVVAGKSFSYQLVVKSNSPAVTFKLRSGPPDLTVSSSGRVKWNVPDKLQRAVVAVVAITDEAGKEYRHEIELIPTLPPPD
jgi:S1-C subfamily serine protease